MDEPLRLYVQKITKLPTIPAIAQEILNILNDDLTSINRLENIIEKDPAISAKILSVANSAFFGYQTASGTIANAIMRIGMSNVRNIALGISLISAFSDEGSLNTADAQYRRIFKHSLAVGIIARNLARELKMHISDDIFTNGILHDLGLMVLNKYFPKMFLKVLGEAEKEKYFLTAEKKILGFTHEDIGIWLADKWNLPEDILTTIGHHHTPMLAQSSYQKHAALIHVADFIITVNVLNITDHDPEYPLDKAALDLLGISESYFDTLRTSVTKEMLSDEMFN